MSVDVPVSRRKKWRGVYADDGDFFFVPLVVA